MSEQKPITKDERESLNVANCLCCTLAESMRDCNNPVHPCAFNAGLVFKTLASLAKINTPANLGAQRAAFIQQIQDSNLNLSVL